MLILSYLYKVCDFKASPFFFDRIIICLHAVILFSIVSTSNSRYLVACKRTPRFTNFTVYLLKVKFHNTFV